MGNTCWAATMHALDSSKLDIGSGAKRIATEHVQLAVAERMVSCFSVQHMYRALVYGSPILFADPVSVGFGWSKKTKEPMVLPYLPCSMLPSANVKLGAAVSRLCKTFSQCKATAKVTPGCDKTGSYLYCDGTAGSRHWCISCILQIYVQVSHLFSTCSRTDVRNYTVLSAVGKICCLLTLVNPLPARGIWQAVRTHLTSYQQASGQSCSPATLHSIRSFVRSFVHSSIHAFHSSIHAFITKNI